MRAQGMALRDVRQAIDATYKGIAMPTPYPGT
jgi:hypothetical protein